MDFADDLMSLRPLAVAAQRASVISAVARAALRNAIALALAREPPDRSVLPRILTISERLEPQDRDLVRRHIESLSPPSSAPPPTGFVVSPRPMV
jgi:hypothetical protein